MENDISNLCSNSTIKANYYCILQKFEISISKKQTEISEQSGVSTNWVEEIFVRAPNIIIHSGLILLLSRSQVEFEKDKDTKESGDENDEKVGSTESLANDTKKAEKVEEVDEDSASEKSDQKGKP